MLRICERRGWSYAVFYNLPVTEQDDLLAYEYQRQQEIQQFLKRAFDQTTVYAESVTAQALLALVLNG